MKLVNKSGRIRMIPTPVEMTRLLPGGELELTEYLLTELKRHPNVRNWLHKGYLAVEDAALSPDAPKANYEEREAPDLPEGVTGQGTEIVEASPGWYLVYNNGMPCTDKKVRKAEAEEIAKDYGPYPVP